MLVVPNFSKSHTELATSTDGQSLLLGDQFVDFRVNGKEVAAVINSQRRKVSGRWKVSFEIQLRSDEGETLPSQWVAFSKLVSGDNNRVVHTLLGRFFIQNPGVLPTLKELQTHNVSWLKEWVLQHQEVDSQNREISSLSWRTYKHTSVDGSAVSAEQSWSS